MSHLKYDLIVAGGGTAGAASTIAASRCGIKVLLIEKNGFCGGTATSTLVTPMMKNILKDGTSLNCDLLKEVLERLKKDGFSDTNFDNNAGWFAPEMMKFVLDDMLEEANANILFHSHVFDCEVDNKKIKNIKVLNNSGISTLEAKFFIDSTSDAILATQAGVPFEFGNNGTNQSMSHRFVLGGVNLQQFSEWLKLKDPSSVSPVFTSSSGNILLTTAYTSEDKLWALKDLFLDAIDKQIIESYDANYFQIFTAPGYHDSVFLNCPRIYTPHNLSSINYDHITYAQIMGRKQIRRLVKFCQLYFPGFQKAYISNTANDIGIRDSRRIKGKYTLTVDDIASGKKFADAVAKCNYPIDIHSSEEGKGGLTYLKENDYYEIPLKCLESYEIDNLLVASKCISAEFKAQASLRIQPTCWAIGESAGKNAAKRILNHN